MIIQIIEVTAVLIAIYIVLVKVPASNTQGVLDTTGKQFTNIVTTLQGR